MLLRRHRDIRRPHGAVVQQCPVGQPAGIMCRAPELYVFTRTQRKPPVFSILPALVRGCGLPVRIQPQHHGNGGDGALRRSPAGRGSAGAVGYLSVNDRCLHFGLGAATDADLTVRWPSGAVEILAKLACDQLVTIREGAEVSRGTTLRRHEPACPD